MILLDTNLLTRMTRSHEPQSGVARAAIQTLLQRRERLLVVPQNLYEFWAVATRAFLCGQDAVTGKNFDHRKAWIQQRSS